MGLLLDDDVLVAVSAVSAEMRQWVHKYRNTLAKNDPESLEAWSVVAFPHHAVEELDAFSAIRAGVLCYYPIHGYPFKVLSSRCAMS